MKKACVIGWPIEHSRSPLIHGYWLKKYGIEGSYTKQAVKPEDLEAFLRNLAAEGYAGCNVTVPHKEAAFALADVQRPVGDCSWRCQYAVVESGKLHAANTDTYGFMSHLAQQAPHVAPAASPCCGSRRRRGSARDCLWLSRRRRARMCAFSIARMRGREELARHFGARVTAFGLRISTPIRATRASSSIPRHSA